MNVVKNQNVRQSSRSIKLAVIVIVLWLTVIASSLAVISVAYDTRVKFNELEVLRREQGQLQVVWGQYLLEESTWASYGRVERLAQEKLSMAVPEAEKIIMIVSDGGSDEG